MSSTNQNLIETSGLELLEKLFESSGEGIMLFNGKGEIVLINPRAQDMFGYREKELLGMTMEALVPEKFRKNHVGHRTAYMDKPAPRRMGAGRDLEGLRKDGSTFPLEISLSFLVHEEEKLVVAFITDISIRKRQEAQLEEQRQKLQGYTLELEQKVKERTSELEHMNLGLESQIQERKLAEVALKDSLNELKSAKQEILKSLEKEKMLGTLKSRFVSMASHEFRTPLTTVLSSANLIAKYKEADQQQSREKHVERIRKSVQNLTTILNDFLSLEKLESGMHKVDTSAIDLNETMLDVIEEMSINLKEGQKIDYKEHALQLETDPHILKNILINLISNAIKYSNPGDPIDITVKQKSKAVTIAIKDAGIGIPEEEQKDLFGRFFRAGNATNIQGTGLGLHIVRKYVDLLSGNIRFKSVEGEGSTFTLELPC